MNSCEGTILDIGREGRQTNMNTGNEERKVELYAPRYIKSSMEIQYALVPSDGHRTLYFPSPIAWQKKQSMPVSLRRCIQSTAFIRRNVMQCRSPAFPLRFVHWHGFACATGTAAAAGGSGGGRHSKIHSRVLGLCSCRYTSHCCCIRYRYPC